MSVTPAAIRAFIAIDLSVDVSRQLEEVSRHLKRQMPGQAVRWVAVKNIHLTIKFLGDVSVGNLEMLQRALQTETARHPTFQFDVSGLGAFPSNRRPRVIWVGVQAPPQLQALQRGVENEMARLGYAPEERGFSPHLTLGRVARNVTPEEVRRIGDVLQSSRVGLLGSTQANAVHLYRSDLQPGGAIYTRLFTAALNQPSQPN